MLALGAATFCVCEPPSSAVGRAGEAAGQGLGPERAGGAAMPGAQGVDAEARVHWHLVDGGQEVRVEGQVAQSGPGHERAAWCERGGQGEE